METPLLEEFSVERWTEPVDASWSTATTPGVAESLRSLALRADSSSRPVDVGMLWTELCSRRCRIADYFFSETSCFIALAPALAVSPFDRKLTRKKLDVLERVLLRGGQKPVAVELGIAPSTVAIIAGSCLRAMGLDCGASRAPLPLALSVHALHQRTELREARLSHVTHQGRSYSVLSTPRPERCLARELSPAEYAVTRLLIEGRSHAQISALRHTSVRTVANQLAAAFHKLGVSGRCELVCRLVASEFESKPKLATPATPRLAPAANVMNA